MLPVIARTMFRTQEALLGRRTFANFKDLLRSERWPREDLDALRLERLRKVVATAYEKTPYWQSLMDEHGIRPADIRTLADLGRFPLLDKHTVREQREEMVWRQEGRRVMLSRTSGSTNAAMAYYTSSNREAHISAARMRGHASVGVWPGDTEIYFWAAPAEVTTQTRIKDLRDYLTNNPLSNAVEITKDAVPDYLAQWKRWRPACLFGYVSSVSLLAKLATEQELDLTALKGLGLKAIVTTSEMLRDDDRRLISNAFAVPVFDSYGLREAGLVGHECDHFTMHTVDEQLILETIDPRTLEPVDGEGELVLTCLANEVMPMIRYRTNDIVTLSTKPCPCGRTLHSLRVTGGRVSDFVVAADGKWVSAVAWLYLCRTTPGIAELQVRQDRLGEVRILVVPERDRPADLANKILVQARRKMSAGDTVLVELVNRIEPVASNKYRYVVSKVAEELLA